MKNVRAVPRLPRRAEGGHKGDYGTVLVVAGSHAMLGAAVLCATSALRGGAGLVQVALPAALQPLLPLAVPCATTIERTSAAVRRACLAADAVVVGPGLGATAATKGLVRSILRAGDAPVVLDADALNVLAPLRARVAPRRRVVLTPHPGEAARLLGTSAAAVQQGRKAALAALCERSGAVVVLKGAGTLVGDGERCFANTSGNPGMATAGSGDVLAGLLGALLAQGMAPFEAACAAVWLHGAAGRIAGPGLIAEDLPAALPGAMRRLGEGGTDNER